MNILLKPSPKIPTCWKKIKSPQSEDAAQAHLRAHPCPFPAWTIYFLLNPKGPKETRSQASCGQQHLHLGLPLIPSPGPLSLTSRWTNRCPDLAHSFPITFLGAKASLPRLSPITSSTPGLSFLSLSPALTNGLPKSPGLVLWNISSTKSRTHTLPAGLRQTRSRQVPVQEHLD